MKLYVSLNSKLYTLRILSECEQKQMSHCQLPSTTEICEVPEKTEWEEKEEAWVFFFNKMELWKHVQGKLIIVFALKIQA